MTIVRKDTFTRANQTGWGTASDGNTWTKQAGAGTQNIVSNEGTLSSTTSSFFSTLGASLSGGDAEGLVRLDFTNATLDAGILLRFKDTNNWYLLRYNASNTWQFLKKVGGTTSTVGSFTVTMATSTFYWLRFRCQGSTIEARVWQDGTGEPSTWNYTTTDTSLAGTGGSSNFVGLYGFISSGTINFDNFQVDDLASTINLTGTLAGAGALTANGLTISRPLTGALIGGDSISGVLSLTLALTGKIAGASACSGRLHITRPLTGALAGADAISGTLTVQSASGNGTGIGDLAVTTKSQSWSGGPPGSPGTETDVTYTDATNSGWTVGMIPSYGAMPISPWYEVDTGTTSASQTGLGTTSPDGHIHWLEQSSGGAFSGSEDVTFKNAGNFTELAPAGTPFRRYYQAQGDTNDANGFQWAAYVCIYPGDPGLIAYRFDLHNPSGSAKSLAASNSLDIALLGGLQQSDSTWAATNGGYGTVGGANIAGWPVSANIDPDYVYITPNSAAAGIHIGQVTVKKTTLASLGWTSPVLVYQQASGASGRLKIAVEGNKSSFAAGATETVYLLNVLRRNLTSSDAIAIAADYLAPGTPTVSAGSFTSFSYDERAYQFAAAASGHDLSATLDMTPSNVTVRYKPIFKITGWTDNAAPRLLWGGSQLHAGADYRWTWDSSNSILYVQLYFDVVASGATTGQRNNAALQVASSANVLTGTLAGGGNLHASGLAITRALNTAVQTGGALHATLTHGVPLHATLPSGGNVNAAHLAITRPLSGIITGIGATGVPSIEALSNIVATALRGTVAGAGGLHGVLTALPGNIQLSGTVAGADTISATGLAIARQLAASVRGAGGCSGVLSFTSTSRPAHHPAGVTIRRTGAGIPSATTAARTPALVGSTVEE